MGTLKSAFWFMAMMVVFGYAAMIPAASMTKPYGLWISIPMFFVGVFSAISLTIRIDDGRLEGLGDIFAALKDGKDLLISWAIYMAILIVSTGLLVLILS